MTFALLLVTALASLESTVVSTAMPTIIGELRGLPVYSWVFSAYLLAATVTMPIYGRLADLYGRRRIMLIAIALFVAGAATCAAAQTMTQLIAARVLQGLGAGGLMPVALIVTGDLFTLRERARIQGLFSGVWGVASLAGPILGAVLTVTFGWRSIFSINLPAGRASPSSLVATKMIETRASRPDPLDVRGALLLAGGITALLLSVLQKAGGAPLAPALRVALIAAAASPSSPLRARSRRGASIRSSRPSLFRHARTVAPYVAGALLGTTIFGVDTFVPLFVQGARGGTAMAAGAVVTPVVLMWAVSAAVAARAVVRLRLPPHRPARGRPHPARPASASSPARSCTPTSAPSPRPARSSALGLGPSSMSQVLAIQHAADEQPPRRGHQPGAVLPRGGRRPGRRRPGRAAGHGPVPPPRAGGGDGGRAPRARSRRRPRPRPRTSSAWAPPWKARCCPSSCVLLVLAALNVAVASSFPAYVERTERRRRLTRRRAG